MDTSRFPWTELSGPALDHLIGQLDVSQDVFFFIRGLTSIRETAPAFLNGWRYCRAVTRSTVPPYTMDFLADGDGTRIIVLDGDAGAVQALFEQVAPRWADDVVGYAVFFIAAFVDDGGTEPQVLSPPRRGEDGAWELTVAFRPDEGDPAGPRRYAVRVGTDGIVRLERDLDRPAAFVMDPVPGG